MIKYVDNDDSIINDNSKSVLLLMLILINIMLKLDNLLRLVNSQVFDTCQGEWPVDFTMWILMQWKRSCSKLRESEMFELDR
jgi:hypothetical protein